MRALQEDLLERQRPEETPSEKHQVPIGTREEYHRETHKNWCVLEKQSKLIFLKLANFILALILLNWSWHQIQIFWV